MKRQKYVAFVFTVIAVLVIGALAHADVTTVYWYGRADSEWHERPTIELFNETHDHIQIEYVLSRGGFASYYDEIITAAAGGVAPDIIWIDWRSREFGPQGLLYDLTDWVSEMDIDPFMQPLMDSMSFEGRVYAMPITWSPIYAYYNQGLFDQSGIGYPSGWTFDEFLDQAKKLTRRSGDDVTQYGFSTWTHGFEWIGPFVHSFGGHFLDESGTELLLGEPEALEGLRFMADLIHVHDVWQGHRPWHGSFVTNDVAIEFNGTWQITYFRDMDVDFEITQIPVGPAGSVSPSLAFGHALTTWTEQPEAAMEVLKWLISPEAQLFKMELFGHTPASLEVLRSDEFLRPLNPPFNMMTFVHALETGHEVRLSKFQGEIMGTIVQHLDAVWRGEMPVENAVAQAADVIRGIVGSENR